MIAINSPECQSFKNYIFCVSLANIYNQNLVVRQNLTWNPYVILP